MPASLILLSILGLAPFVGCGLVAIGPDPTAAGRMLTALIGWSALILAFVGGLHWGFVLQEPEPPATASLAATASESLRSRPLAPVRVRHAWIGLAVLPLILGWVALLLPLVAAEWLALLLLIVGYIATLLAEHRFSARVALPLRYLWLRWGFTIVAVAMLTTVLTLRLLGQTIVL